MSDSFSIELAVSTKDVEAVKTLFMEYADWLDDDLCFQGYDEEIATFPSFYLFLLIAKQGESIAGGVGLKDLGEGICEMKRLYVPDAFKGKGLGRRLTEHLIEEAQTRGFTSMRLDTLPKLEAAIALYRKLGFEEIPAYYHNPIEGVVYFEKAL